MSDVHAVFTLPDPLTFFEPATVVSTVDADELVDATVSTAAASGAATVAPASVAATVVAPPTYPATVV